jgi:hypothetical protein
MDNDTVITILVFTGLSSLCICCICIQALRFKMKEISIEKMREIAKKKRKELRNNYLVHPQEVTLIIHQ